MKMLKHLGPAVLFWAEKAWSGVILFWAALYIGLCMMWDGLTGNVDEEESDEEWALLTAAWRPEKNKEEKADD